MNVLLINGRSLSCDTILSHNTVEANSGDIIDSNYKERGQVIVENTFGTPIRSSYYQFYLHAIARYGKPFDKVRLR